MADDIFLTPEEQDERARQWLKSNGPALAIGVALGLAAIFGYEKYSANKIIQAQNASALYASTLDEVNASSLSDINAQVNKLKDSHSDSSYAAKASLLKAKQLSETDLDAAYAELQWVVDHASEAGLQHTARIRQAKIKLAQGDIEQAQALGQHTPTQGFESNYSEILAEVSLKQGDEAAAREYYQKAIETLPASQSSYARVLSLKLDRLPESEASVVDVKQNTSAASVPEELAEKASATTSSSVSEASTSVESEAVDLSSQANDAATKLVEENAESTQQAESK